MSELRQIVIEGLVAAADIGLIVLCYKVFKDKCAAADKLEHQEALDWSTLKSKVADAAGQTIQYGIIEGTVRSLGGSLKSQFTDVEGPVKRFKRTLMKSERHRGYWTDSSSTLSESYDKVPFALIDPKGGAESGGSVLVVDPTSADFLLESLHTTHDHFEPTPRSILENVFDRVVGDISKGYQTTEQILKNGVRMLGIGKIVLRKDSLELRKPTEAGSRYILTTMSKTELIEHLKSRATVYKILTAIFSVAGVAILWVSVGGRIRHWMEERRSRAAIDAVRAQIAHMGEESRSPADANPDTDSNNTCVICLTNRRDLAIRPCGHVCTCLTCYEAMPTPRKCPICRNTIGDIIPIFIS